MFIQTESTPNDNSVKFIPGTPVMGAKGSMEFINAREAMASPLAKKLFLIDGVESVFFGPDFVAVNKTDTVSWPQLKPDIFATLMDFFSSGQEILDDGHSSQASDTRIEPGDSETVQMIKELLETRIRPSIQEDGGDIEYMGFADGIVKLKLRGACRTCDSSSVTLKHGIQNMLMHYIPEVQGVEQIQDDLEQLSNSVFEKVDSKLSSS